MEIVILYLNFKLFICVVVHLSACCLVKIKHPSKYQLYQT
jgi:hypothetical protein